MGDRIDSTQPASRARLDAAIELALRTGPARVDAADAATWLPAQRARDSVQSALHEASHRANEPNPLACLRFEFPARERTAQFKLTEWPDGLTRTLADAHPHGQWVRRGKADA